MCDGRKIKTPQTDPEHWCIGHLFGAYCFDSNKRQVYVCDSHEENAGFWMTRVDAPEDNKQDQHSTWRRNVSERAIGRRFYHANECTHKNCQMPDVIGPIAL